MYVEDLAVDDRFVVRTGEGVATDGLVVEGRSAVNESTHASWLNQVELFFSILERRRLRNGEFDSLDDLATRIIGFINDYNRRARPLRWTYDGRPPTLKVA